jgi:hypothetical protein
VQVRAQISRVAAQPPPAPQAMQMVAPVNPSSHGRSIGMPSQ